jgi:hypothetical protein
MFIPMRLLATCAVFSILLAVRAASDPTPTPTPIKPVDRKAAELIAVQSFKRETKGQIEKYRVKALPRSGSEWQFEIEGLAEFARPGYHWLVRVDRKTGHATVVGGE